MKAAANPGLEPTGLVSALFDCSTRLQWVLWRKLFPASAQRLNPDRWAATLEGAVNSKYPIFAQISGSLLENATNLA